MPQRDNPATADEHIIETPRLLLRPMRVDDTDALLCIFADPLVMAAFESDLFDRQQMARWIQRNLDHQARYGYGLYSVMLKANQLLVGDCGLTRMPVAGRAEVESAMISAATTGIRGWQRRRRQPCATMRFRFWACRAWSA